VFTNSLNYYLSTLFFNAFPFPAARGGNSRRAALCGGAGEPGMQHLFFRRAAGSETGEIDTFVRESDTGVEARDPGCAGADHGDRSCAQGGLEFHAPVGFG